MPSGRSGGSGITGWQDGSGIGSGLLLPGVRGSALRRKTRELDSTTGAGDTKLSKLIPRFIRLSALVAAELGREARGEEEEVGDNGRDKVRESTGPANWNLGAPPSPMTPRIQLQTRMFENALRPSLEWYMLLAGLLTRAVLEGYLTAGWSGLQAIQCLLLVGLGLNSNTGNLEKEEEDAEFADMDPDELPNLVDAVKVLFPALRDGGLSPKGREEEEYEAEMLERLRKVSFFIIEPLLIPYLSILCSHLTPLLSSSTTSLHPLPIAQLTWKILHGNTLPNQLNDLLFVSVKPLLDGEVNQNLKP
jgi:hypothetical protein